LEKKVGKEGVDKIMNKNLRKIYRYLREQLGALKSVIRQTYKAIGCSDDIIEGEDWGGLPSRVACLKAALAIMPATDSITITDRFQKGRGMRCHKCCDGELQATTLMPSDEGWAVSCNKCDYSTFVDHPPDCHWHYDWHSCNCGLF